jgi:hypothetical protein
MATSSSRSLSLMLAARSWRCSVASLAGSITPSGRRRLALLKAQARLPRLGSSAGQLAFLAEAMACSVQCGMHVQSFLRAVAVLL